MRPSKGRFPPQLPRRAGFGIQHVAQLRILESATVNKPKPKRASTLASRTAKKGVRSKKGSWVRRHPAIVLGTMAAGAGALAVLRSNRKTPRKGSKAKKRSGARSAKSAR